ncbi:MAG: DUF4403 family protein [Bacteroidota bacterium]|nr:DUF4403 family protein [Bacteroidota bacterium]
MNTFFLKCAALAIMIFLTGCSSSKKISSSNTTNQTLPELPASEIDISVKIAAKPILDKAEKVVPAEFTSDAWPGFIQPSCDFRYKYRFVRSALQVSCSNNVISVHFSGNYQVGGSKCLCTAGIPISPWISGSCGFPPQPLRKVNMGLRSTLRFLPDYRVRTTTTITGIQPVDKCQVSVFSNDITQLVMDSIRSSLVSFSSAMDQTVAGLDFSKFVQRVRDSSFHKVSLGKYGFILMNPLGLRIGQLNYANDSFNISFGLSCKPLLTSDPADPVGPLPSLPSLLQTENRKGIRLYLNMVYDYAFLNRLLQDSLHNKVFEVKGRTLVVKNAVISGSDNNQVNIRVDFAGSNHGSIFLKGTPVLDTAKQTLAIPDISYSLEGADLALKIARSLFRNKIRETIQGKSYLDIGAWVNANRLPVDHQLNREVTKGIFSFGKLHEARIIGLLTTKENIQVQLFITADLGIASGNL